MTIQFHDPALPAMQNGETRSPLVDDQGRLQVVIASGGGGGAVNLTQINGAAVSSTNPLWIAPSTSALFQVDFADQLSPCFVSQSGAWGVDQGAPQGDSGQAWFMKIGDGSSAQTPAKVYAAGATPNPNADASLAVRNIQNARTGGADVSSSNPLPVVVYPATATDASFTIYRNVTPGASFQARSTACVLVRAQWLLTTSSARYIMLFNSTTLPADGTVPDVCIPTSSSLLYANLPPELQGVMFSTGCYVVLSTTAASLTKTLSNELSVIRMSFR